MKPEDSLVNLPLVEVKPCDISVTEGKTVKIHLFLWQYESVIKCVNNFKLVLLTLKNHLSK